MGNLQGGEGKHPKNGKSPGRGKSFMKNKKEAAKEKKRIKSESQLSNNLIIETAPSLRGSTEQIVTENIAAEREVPAQSSVIQKTVLPTVHVDAGGREAGGDDSNCQTGGLRSTNRDFSAVHSSNHNKDSELANKNSTLITDSWKQVEKLSDPKGPNNSTRKELTPPSKESSSESVFTDPLTPVGFAAEINQCYYSEESVNVNLEEGKRYVRPIGSKTKFCENGVSSHKKDAQSREKLGKLSVSKVSCVSLDDILDEDNIFILTDTMPDAGTDDVCENSNLDFHQVSNQNVLYKVSPVEDISKKIDVDHIDGEVIVSNDQTVNKSDFVMGNWETTAVKKEKSDASSKENDSLDSPEVKLRGSALSTSFTLSRHRKVDLPPSKVNEACLQGNLITLFIKKNTLNSAVFRAIPV